MLGELSFDWLFKPVEDLDEWLTGLFEGAPLAVALGIAFVLGLRHASDPDHLVAVTSLVTTEGGGGTRGAARLGAWWGLGHATTLILIGIPLIAFKSELPAWLESAAEKAVGFVIIFLAARIVWKWVRGDYRSGPHDHSTESHRHLHHAETEHSHRAVRGPRQAFAIGTLHGLAGTGAVVVLLITALPDQAEATAALAVFAPMSVFSMALCTTIYSWILTRPVIDPGLPHGAHPGPRGLRADVRPVVFGYYLSMEREEHGHDEAHVHEHEHDDGTVHSHPHTSHEHSHVEHEHEHTHEDGTTHSHPHVHEEGLEHSQDEAHFHDH